MENVFRKNEVGYSVTFNTINKRTKEERVISHVFNVSFKDEKEKACTIISTIDGVKEIYAIDEETRKCWENMLEKRETLPRSFVDSIKESDKFDSERDRKAPHEYRLVALYRHVCSVLKAEDKERRFEKSGILFIYKGEELRFKPVYCTDGNNEFVLFKTITGDGICYLKREENRPVFGLYGKGGRNSVLKADLIANNAGLLKALFNDLTNGMKWEKLISLCNEVDGYGTCSVPKVLR